MVFATAGFALLRKNGRRFRRPAPPSRTGVRLFARERTHTTIEKSPRLHALVMQKIAAVVKKDLAKKIAASKAKPNSRKSKPVAGRDEPPADDRSTTDVMTATNTRGS